MILLKLSFIPEEVRPLLSQRRSPGLSLSSHLFSSHLFSLLILLSAPLSTSSSTCLGETCGDLQHDGELN
jgi:hypothetical protein